SLLGYFSAHCWKASSRPKLLRWKNYKTSHGIQRCFSGSLTPGPHDFDPLLWFPLGPSVTLERHIQIPQRGLYGLTVLPPVGAWLYERGWNISTDMAFFGC